MMNTDEKVLKIIAYWLEQLSTTMTDIELSLGSIKESLQRIEQNMEQR